MSRHHHPEHRLVDREETERRLGERRAKNLAWFGVVLIVVIFAFVGLAVFAGGKDVPAQVKPVPPATEPAQVQTSPDLPPADPLPSWLNPPTIPGYGPNGKVIGIPNPDRPHKVHHAAPAEPRHRVKRGEHRPHARRDNVPSHRYVPHHKRWFCNEPKLIPGYDHHGKVVAIKNPGCK